MIPAFSLRIAELLLESAQIANSFLSDPCPELKQDRTVVTKADRAVEAFLTRQLEDSANGIYLIGEETFNRRTASYFDSALRGKTWIVDPVDGTAMFAHRIPFWGVSIGYAENGHLREGGIFVPGTGEMLLSGEGRTYYAQSPLPPEQWKAAELLSELSTPAILSLDDSSIVNLSQHLVHSARIKGAQTVNALCSSVYSAVLLATGRHAVELCRAKLWDHAGYLVALKNLGFHCWSKSGVDPLSLEITPDIYNLHYDSPRAFAVTDVFAMAVSEKIARDGMSLIVPEVSCD